MKAKLFKELDNKNKIGIIGMGIVGQALYLNINDGLYDYVEIFESQYQAPFDGAYNIDELHNIRYLFICVDTPTKNNKQNAKSLTSILDVLSTHKYQGLVIIKSTVLYSNIKNYLYLNIIVQPEFLQELNSSDDLYNQEYYIVGSNNTIHSNELSEVINSCFKHKKQKLTFEFCSIQEAIDFKYLRNLKQAWNLIFWEMVYDVVPNQRKISEFMKYMPVQENDKVGMDGYRGFGGSCLPKDIQALQSEHNHPMIKALLEYNQQLKEK